VPHVLIRVSLPDRPGGLGQVASRIGSVRGDIVGVDVLERTSDVAVDEFAVRLDDLDVLPTLLREIEEVDGVSVVDVRTVERASGIGLLESAARLCEVESVDALRALLVGEARYEFRADAAALMDGDRVLVADGDEVAAIGTEACGDVAMVSLTAHGATLAVVRRGHPFHPPERERLATLARIADRTWGLLEQG
jgi:hypothetical protein